MPALVAGHARLGGRRCAQRRGWPGQAQADALRSAMVEIPITIACGNYDRTSAIRDGRVKVEGCAVTYLPMYPEEIFHRAFKFQEFDVSEISFSSYIRTVATGTSASCGHSGLRIADFPPLGDLHPQGCGHRGSPKTFAASASACRNIRSPQSSGCAGLMQHEYGVLPSDIHWRSGGQEQPGRHERTPLKPIKGVDLDADRRSARRSSACSRTANLTPCSPPARRPRT